MYPQWSGNRCLPGCCQLLYAASSQSRPHNHPPLPVSVGCMPHGISAHMCHLLPFWRGSLCKRTVFNVYLAILKRYGIHHPPLRAPAHITEEVELLHCQSVGPWAVSKRAPQLLPQPKPDTLDLQACCESLQPADKGRGAICQRMKRGLALIAHEKVIFNIMMQSVLRAHLLSNFILSCGTGPGSGHLHECLNSLVDVASEDVRVDHKLEQLAGGEGGHTSTPEIAVDVCSILS